MTTALTIRNLESGDPGVLSVPSSLSSDPGSSTIEMRPRRSGGANVTTRVWRITLSPHKPRLPATVPDLAPGDRGTSRILFWVCTHGPSPGEAPPVAREPDHRFAELASRWKADVAHLSSIEEMILHPAYQQIIGLGPAALPLILRELEGEPDFWFAALRALTGEDPVKPEQRGRIAEMTDAWLRWARENGLEW